MPSFEPYYRRHLIGLNYFKVFPLLLWINALLLDLNSLMNGTDDWILGNDGTVFDKIR